MIECEYLERLVPNEEYKKIFNSSKEVVDL